jgi:hypothetical protein
MICACCVIVVSSAARYRTGELQATEPGRRSIDSAPRITVDVAAKKLKALAQRIGV